MSQDGLVYMLLGATVAGWIAFELNRARLLRRLLRSSRQQTPTSQPQQMLPGSMLMRAKLEAIEFTDAQGVVLHRTRAILLDGTAMLTEAFQAPAAGQYAIGLVYRGMVTDMEEGDVIIEAVFVP